MGAAMKWNGINKCFVCGDEVDLCEENQDIKYCMTHICNGLGVHIVG